MANKERIRDMLIDRQTGFEPVGVGLSPTPVNNNLNSRGGE